GVGYRWMFDIDYLTDSINYIPVSLENQPNLHAGASEVTNSAGTSQTPSSNASEQKDEYVELIVVPSTVRNTKEKAESRKSSLLPAMLLVATTNPNAGQEYPDVAQSQPSSSIIPVPSTSLPPEQSPQPIPTPIPASTPTPIPETDPAPMEHTFEEPSPAHQHFSPPQEHAQEQMSVDDLLQLVPQLMTDSLT
ncbi:hypothetical protein Tco_1196430, partial [Tanacetum coccineum]